MAKSWMDIQPLGLLFLLILGLPGGIAMLALLGKTNQYVGVWAFFGSIVASYLVGHWLACWRWSRSRQAEIADALVERELRTMGIQGQHPSNAHERVVDLRSDEDRAKEERAKHPLDTEDEATARELAQLVAAALRDKSREAESRIREIGQRLADAGGGQSWVGGDEKMILIAYRVVVIGREMGLQPGGTMSALETFWHGIGGWRR